MTAIILTPGPDSLLIMRNAANSGRLVGLATMLGVQLGVCIHTVLALIGVTEFLAQRAFVILVIGLAGAAFIFYLAWQTWTAGVLAGNLRGAKRTSAAKALWDALLTNLLNPKVIIAFFALLLPRISPDFPQAPQVLAMGLVVLLINTVWQTSLVFGSAWFFRVLTNPTAQQWINRSVATVLVVLGVLLPFQAYDKATSLPNDSSQPSSSQIEGSLLN